MPATSSLKFSLAILLSLALAVPVHSVPTPQAEVGNAYSGSGGHADGGGVSTPSGSRAGSGPLGGLELLDIFSRTSPRVFTRSPHSSLFPRSKIMPAPAARRAQALRSRAGRVPQTQTITIRKATRTAAREGPQTAVRSAAARPR